MLKQLKTIEIHIPADHIKIQIIFNTQISFYNQHIAKALIT